MGSECTYFKFFDSVIFSLSFLKIKLNIKLYGHHLF